MTDRVAEQITIMMVKKGYILLSREDYHREKKKFIHGCWRIGKDYYYFINFDEFNPEEYLRQMKVRNLKGEGNK